MCIAWSLPQEGSAGLLMEGLLSWPVSADPPTQLLWRLPHFWSPWVELEGILSASLSTSELSRVPWYQVSFSGAHLHLGPLQCLQAGILFSFFTTGLTGTLCFSPLAHRHLWQINPKLEHFPPCLAWDLSQYFIPDSPYQLLRLNTRHSIAQQVFTVCYVLGTLKQSIVF